MRPRWDPARGLEEVFVGYEHPHPLHHAMKVVRRLRDAQMLSTACAVKLADSRSRRSSCVQQNPNSTNNGECSGPSIAEFAR
jgi:hypothetical protein